MKKLILAAIFIFMSNLFAQDDIGLGTYTLGGGISFKSSFEEDDDDVQTEFSFGPSFYIFVSKYVALGGSMTYTNSENGLSSTTFGIGPGIKFFVHPHNKFKINFALNYSYLRTEFEEYDDYYSTWYVSFAVGFDIFLAKNVALEPYIDFRRMDRSYSDMDDLPWVFEASEGIRIAIFIF